LAHTRSDVNVNGMRSRHGVPIFPNTTTR